MANNAVTHMLTGKAVQHASRWLLLVDSPVSAMIVSDEFNVQAPCLAPAQDITEVEAESSTALPGEIVHESKRHVPERLLRQHWQTLKQWKICTMKFWLGEWPLKKRSCHTYNNNNNNNNNKQVYLQLPRVRFTYTVHTSSFRQITYDRRPPSLDWWAVSSGCDLLQPVRTLMSLIVSTVWCCRCIVFGASRVFAFLQGILLLLFSLSGSHDLCIGVHSMTVCVCGRAQVTHALFQVLVGYYCQFVFSIQLIRNILRQSHISIDVILRSPRAFRVQASAP